MARAARLHRRDHGIDTKEGALEIDVEEPVVVGFRCRAGGRQADDPGAVDEDLDVAEGRHDRRDHGADLGHVGDVGAKRSGRAASRLDFGHHGLGLAEIAARDHRDPRALGGETQRDGLADARRAAGDQCDLVRQFHDHLPKSWTHNGPLRRAERETRDDRREFRLDGAMRRTRRLDS